MKIAILLPFKDTYTKNKAGSASIWVKDFIKKSKYKTKILIYGYIKKLNKKNFISKGDDYQILFTANSSKSRIISKLSKTLNIKISKIGKICSISQKSQIIDEKGKKIAVKTKGYSHRF